jgi:hypothetical protein
MAILTDSSLLIEDERGTIRLEEWLHLYPVATANLRDFIKIPGPQVLHWKGSPLK